MNSDSPNLIFTITGRISDAWYWLIGWPCPRCKIRGFGWKFHMCADLKNLSTKEQVKALTNTVRGILEDEPADQFVHIAFEACDHLDKTFEPEKNADASL